MQDRIEILYGAVDQIAQAIIRNQIPLSEPIYDPLVENNLEKVSWPESYIRYKNKVKQSEIEFGYEPLTDLQWSFVEMYLSAQYNLKLEEEVKS